MGVLKELEKITDTISTSEIIINETDCFLISEQLKVDTWKTAMYLPFYFMLK